MWKDYDDRINELFSNLRMINKFPTVCPMCKKRGAHIYMHIYDDKTRRGGIWSWCSECYSFSHGSIYVPTYWKNCSMVELERLSAVPIYLEEVKDKLDEHVNSIIADIEES